METPIKVSVTGSAYAHMAFASADLTKHGRANDRNKAIIESLVNAGAIEIIDLDAPKPAKINDDGAPL